VLLLFFRQSEKVALPVMSLSVILFYHFSRDLKRHYEKKIVFFEKYG